jgi:hypothetical protein
MVASGIWGEGVQATPTGFAPPKLDNVTVNVSKIEQINSIMRSRSPAMLRGIASIRHTGARLINLSLTQVQSSGTGTGTGSGLYLSDRVP